MLRGPRFDHVERHHQCTEQSWTKVREELIARDQRFCTLLPHNPRDAIAYGVAFFINGERTYGENILQATFMHDDEIIVIQAISGG